MHQIMFLFFGSDFLVSLTYLQGRQGGQRGKFPQGLKV